MESNRNGRTSGPEYIEPGGSRRPVRSPIALGFQDCIGQSPFHNTITGHRSKFCHPPTVEQVNSPDRTNLSSQVHSTAIPVNSGCIPIPISILQELEIQHHSQSTILMQSWHNHKILVQSKNKRAGVYRTRRASRSHQDSMIAFLQLS